MEIMASSKQNRVYDACRKKWVVARPEEVVRQRFIEKMVQSWLFPKELISVEMSLKEIPSVLEAPDRRVDIIAFGKNIHPKYPLYPLLLVECKQEAITLGAWEQLMGYNHYVKASFLVLVNKEEWLVAFCREDSPPQFLSHLPCYEELIKAASQ